jgi:hypothetical protein
MQSAICGWGGQSIAAAGWQGSGVVSARRLFNAETDWPETTPDPVRSDCKRLPEEMRPVGSESMENDVSPAATTEHKLDLPRLFLLAAVLPAAIAAVNYALMGRIVSGQAQTIEVCAQFAWYVVQVGLVGFVVGRGIAHPWLRWVVFGWILLLINLLAGSLAMNAGMGWRPEESMPSAALIAGQMGLCVVWAFMGDTTWTARWPAMILATAGLFFLWLYFGNTWGQRIWTELLVLQVVTLSVLCGGLRLRGFRLLILEQQDHLPATEVARRRPLQFGIKHVLIWTTALAILLGAARGLDLLRWQAAQELVRSGLFWKLTVATTSAIVIIVALWVALGRGHWLVRYATGLIFTLVAGGGLAAWSLYNLAALNNLLNSGSLGLTSRSYHELWTWYEIGYWWLGWLLLSGGLLAATLIILRVLGYRLVRLARQTPSVHGSAA